MRILLTVLIISLGILSVSYANPFAGGTQKPAVTVKKPEGNSFYNYLNSKQKELRDELAGVFRKIKEKPFSDKLFVFALLSFVYGVFHSMGPGHAKSLVSGYLLTTSSGLRRAALFGTMVAFGHAFTSFFLVMVFYYVMKMSVSTGFDSASGVLSKVSFAVIFCIGLYMLYRKFRPAKEEDSARGMLGSAVVISLTPCPGAMVLAMFCITGGLPILGAVSVFSMAAGMALTISGVAVLTSFVKMKGADSGYKFFYSFFEFAGISLLLGFSGFMLLG